MLAIPVRKPCEKPALYAWKPGHREVQMKAKNVSGTSAGQ